jgi:probable HAF family extracellular repeat protein
MTLLGAANRNGVANRINLNLGVVGSLSVPGSTTTRAFYYSNGIMTDLGTLGGASSDARGLNDDGDVVGTAQNAAGQARAFLWRNGVMTDLNTLVPPETGWVLESAAAISNGDQIVGYGTFNGKRRAFLLTPPTDLEARIGGTISQHDSNLPPDGIEVGKTIEWTTSAIAPPFNWSRILYGVRITHTLTGPAVFVSADPHDRDTCSVTPATIICELQPFESDGNGREVTIRARATGTGAITHHATVSGNAPDPDSSNNSIAPEANRAVALSSFAVSPTTVAGGQLTTLEVLLTDRAPGADAVVKLTSSRPDVAPVPATFIVPSWTDHRQTNIYPAVVSSPTSVQISATYGLVTVTKTLTVIPSGLKQLYLTPTTVIGGCGQSQGRVVLSGSAPAGGAVVPLSNTNSKATVPTNVTVPAGSDSATFTVPTVPVTTSASGVVTASFGGVSQSLNLTVRPIRAQTLTLSSARVRGGTTVTGIVTLECPAVPGAIAVSFTSSNPAVAAATVPNITIPSGATSGAFSVRTSAVSSETTVTLYAWVFGVRKAVALTVTP